jgi:hypothetical protein
MPGTCTLSYSSSSLLTRYTSHSQQDYISSSTVSKTSISSSTKGYILFSLGYTSSLTRLHLIPY